jgi:cysteine desulfurase family protein (TIGR01976 family)
MNTTIRDFFPALSRKHNGSPLIFLDGPAGVQVPKRVIEAISNYYKYSNANSHGYFITTRETDQVLDQVRQDMADFLGAEGPETISLGANMTSLNFSLSKAILRVLQAGDEILITQLDHEANRGPWLTLRENGIIVKEVKLLENGKLDYEDFEAKINENTRLVAMGMASNIFGTINDVEKVRKLSHQAGAWLLLDAVHYAPHFPIDVQAIGCDFLLCSAYKFYGPHVGILYSKPGLLDRLQPDRLRTAGQKAPYSIETGTPNHAAFAGVSAAVDFMASLGQGDTKRAQLLDALHLIGEHEKKLAKMLYEGLDKIKGLSLYGPRVSKKLRAPTIAFTLKKRSADEVCQMLAEQNICAWSGHFYAIRATEVLGLLEKGGVTRMGISLYNTEEDIECTLKAVQELAK